MSNRYIPTEEEWKEWKDLGYYPYPRFRCHCPCAGRIKVFQYHRVHGIPEYLVGHTPGWNKGLTKETDERVATQANKLRGRTKETHPSVAAQSEKIKGRPAWNRGLTKETDERVAKYAKSCSKTLKGQVSWNKGKKTGPSSLRYPREERVCARPGCNETFIVPFNSTRKFHARECYWETMRGETREKRVPREVRNCADPECSNTFECNVNSKQRFCGDKKHGRKGQKSTKDHVDKIMTSRRNNGRPWHEDSTKKKIGRSRKGKALWSSSENRDERVRAIILGSQVKPNKAEMKLWKVLNKWLPGSYTYVGDGQFILAGKNPDFININGQKKIIELFGIRWHAKSEEEKRIKIFSDYGYQTLIIWDYELKSLKLLKERVVSFDERK